MKNEKITIFYDSECTLCCRFKQAIEFIDLKKKLQFRSIHDLEVYKEFRDLTFEDCEQEIHLIDLSGKLYRGPEVIVFLVKLFPAVERFAWLIDSDSSKNAMDVFYDKINKIRHKTKADCPKCNKKRSL